MPSTSTAASKRGPVRSTDRCGAIDSVHSKRNCDACRRLTRWRSRRPSNAWAGRSLASELGVNAQGLEPDEVAAVFAGNVTPPGAEPIAMAYAGHQFGSFVPQ